ncbi:MAG TPA: hypothetical protein VMB74_19560 [Streptosporangiaceae bacterium]|nr:hypothetical protein [Streptosporangiaceae bacterium]
MRGAAVSTAVTSRAARVALALAVVPGLLLAWAAGSAQAASAAARPAAARQAAERFHLTTNDAASNRELVRATGPFTARGHAFAGDFAAGHAVSRLVFSRGAVRLVTSAAHSSASVPNPGTCKFTEVSTGSYVIRGGSGRYRHATGSGSYVSRIFGKLKKTRGGGCGSRLASFWQSTRTLGSLHL